MISWQAQTLRFFLKMLNRQKKYDAAKVKKYRSRFERKLRLFSPQNRNVLTKQTTIAGVNVLKIVADKGTKSKRTIIYLHGGGFVVGSARAYQRYMARLATLCQATVIGIDYSLAPENPYPVALDEIVRVWETLLKKGIDTTKTVFMGDSAGGNLALAASLKCKQKKMKQPACLVLLSPALDATFSGKSYLSNQAKEVILTKEALQFFMQSYAQNQAKNDPFISPVFANLTGLPPFLIHVGSEEMLLSDAETVMEHAKRDGVDGTLFIGEGLWHVWHFFASYVPEARDAMSEISSYIINQTER
jgi:acetyl esterase/lipase